MLRHSKRNGFVLVSTLLMLSVLVALLGAYFATTNIELAITRYSKDAVTGFYAAEAGLNLRAEEVRQTFLGYNRPSGTTPTEPDPCTGGNMGSGDFECSTFTLGSYDAVTYITEDPTNPIILTVPPGELYQNLNAQEYRYTVNSVAEGVDGAVDAVLELRFKSRLVPLFQFAAFYNKDLEILPGPVMELAGPVHTNGDLYLNANNRLEIEGQVTTAGDLYRGRKNDSTCKAKPVTVPQGATPTSIHPSCTTRTLVTDDYIEPWNGMIRTNVEEVTVPDPGVLDPTSGEIYWDKADIRIVLALDASNNPDTSNANAPRGISIRNADDSIDAVRSPLLDACPGDMDGDMASNRVVATHDNFYNNREGSFIRMLDVDLQGLFDCIYNNNLLNDGKSLDDTSEGGLVFHLTVKGPDSGTLNNYGVRVANGNPLQSTIGAAPTIQGLTVVSDQAAYSWGHYNKDNKIPAAIMADSYNLLSEVWDDANSQNWAARDPISTTVQAAILAGTDTTGGAEGAGGQGGAYNGGLENYPRFHEDWSPGTLTVTYYGSFVSLNNSRFVDGAWHYGNPQYTAPERDWHYDTDFNDAANLPPLTPRFVYLRQELFVRRYEQ